jgi:hypothetical protein
MSHTSRLVNLLGAGLLLFTSLSWFAALINPMPNTLANALLLTALSVTMLLGSLGVKKWRLSKS